MYWPATSAAQPGTRFEDHMRAALAKKLFPEAIGREEEWLAERLRRHRDPLRLGGL